MRFSTSILLVSALLAQESIASLLNHHHFMGRRSPKTPHDAVKDKLAPTTTAAAATSAAATATPAVQNKVANTGASADISKLLAAGAQAGTNSNSGGAAYIGSGGPYSADFTNGASESIILVIWGNAGSWVNANKPLITYGLTPGQSVTISFAEGTSGGWAGYYSNTQMVMGQISNTWGEFTFADPYTTFDVSREVNMAGNAMSITGGGCTSDMERCVFKCISGNSCLTGYDLFNCETGSQPGAGKGQFAGAASGGCTGSYKGSPLKVVLS